MVSQLRSRKITASFPISKPRGGGRRGGGRVNKRLSNTATKAESPQPAATSAATAAAAASASASAAAGEAAEVLFEVHIPIKRPSTATADNTATTADAIDDVIKLEDAEPNIAALVSSNAIAATSSPSREKKKNKKPRVARGFGASPWPELLHPTADECAEVNRLLTQAHGPSVRPDQLVVNNAVAGCGEVPCVLDALLRTILSLNTTTSNSGKALQGVIARFGLIAAEQEGRKRKYTGKGVGSVDWDTVRRGSVKDLEDAIRAGGLQGRKSKSIKGILDAVFKEGKERKKAAFFAAKARRVAAVKAEGGSDDESELSDTYDSQDEDDDVELTLDYLHNFDNIALLKKLTEFEGIGYKAASCVMLFSLGRSIFPVDTHVHRLSRFLGWVPDKATEVTAFFHLDVRIPDEYKYSLHNLLIRHGRMCRHCKGGPEAKNPARPKPKVKKEEGEEQEPELDEDGNPIKIKRTKKVWRGNGLMKQIVVEVDTDDEAGEMENDDCVIEHLVKRVRKARRVSKGKVEDEDENEDEDEDLNEDQK